MSKALKKLSVIPAIFALILCVMANSCFSLTSNAAYNNEVEFSSDIVYMESLDQGTVIFNKNSTKKTAMASLTKITTAAIVLDYFADNLDKQVTVTQSEIDEIAGTNSSTAGLVAGEQLTVRQLLNLMLVHSANEAAVILAHEAYGSTEAFVEKMNEFAESLGCKNTHYTNPHGLDDDDHYTTAEDLALIIKYALKNDTFKNIVSTPRYTLEATNKRESITYPNTNSLLISTSAYYYEPCKGIKTGTTEDCGYALASYATKNGYSYLCIVIQGAEGYANRGSEGNTAFNETIRAYKWVFENIKLKVVGDSSDTVTVAKVALGRKVDYVRLVPSEEATALIPSNIDSSGISIEAIPETIPDTLYAPVKKGDIVGKANILYAGEVITTVDLAAGDDVSLSIFAAIWYGIKKFFSFTAVQIILALAVIAGIIYFLMKYFGVQRRDNSKVHIVRIDNDVNGTGSLSGRPQAHNKKSKQPQRKRSKKKTYRKKKKKNKLKFKRSKK